MCSCVITTEMIWTTSENCRQHKLFKDGESLDTKDIKTWLGFLYPNSPLEQFVEVWIPLLLFTCMKEVHILHFIYFISLYFAATIIKVRPLIYEPTPSFLPPRKGNPLR